MKSTNSEIIESLKTQNADQYKRLQELERTLTTAITRLGMEMCGSPTGNGLIGDIERLRQKVDSLHDKMEETARKNTRQIIYAVIGCLVLGSLAPAFIMEVVERFMGIFS